MEGYFFCGVEQTDVSNREGFRLGQAVLCVQRQFELREMRPAGQFEVCERDGKNIVSSQLH